MWDLDHKEGWGPKNWCFWTVVLEKTLESPLDCKEVQPVNPQGNQSWIFIGRTDAAAETSILSHLMRRTYSFEKTLMLGKTEGGRRRGRQRMRWLVGLTNSMDMSLSKLQELVGFPCGPAGKESTCSVGDLGLIPGFDPWFGKIPWRRKRLPTPVFWPGEFNGQSMRSQRVKHEWVTSTSTSRSWWWTGKPGVLQSLGLQRIGHSERPNCTERVKLTQHCKSTILH